MVSEAHAVATFGCDERYEVQQFLGQGSYGTVCSALDTRTGEMVAVKKMTNVFSHVGETKRTLREDSDMFSDIFIVTEMMDTDLDQVIRSSQQLSELHVQTFLYQILRGLQYIHAAHVIHRDLKPGNILVNQNCTVKICDFGLARLEPETGYGGFMTEYVVTRWYRAPEIMLSGQDYTQSIDVWSVGCILAEMLGRTPLFPGKNYVDQVRVIVDLLGSPTEAGLMMIEDLEAREYVRSLPRKPAMDFGTKYPQAGPQAAQLLNLLLRFDPNDRCSVEQALEHPYLANIRSEDSDVFQPAAPFKFDFESQDLSMEECRKLVEEEILFYQQQEERNEEEQYSSMQGEEIPFGRDSLQFDEAPMVPQPPGEELKYNSIMMNMKRVMMGHAKETNWGTKLLTPVSEEREEELLRQKREDDSLLAAELAQARAAEAALRRRHQALSQAALAPSQSDGLSSANVAQAGPCREEPACGSLPQRRPVARDISQSAGPAPDSSASSSMRSSAARPMRDPSPSGRRALSAGTTRGARDPSPSGRKAQEAETGVRTRDPSPGVRGRPRSAATGAENRVRASSAGRRKDKMQGMPPTMPRKDQLPVASRQYSKSGRSVSAKKPRPSSAPNTKRTQGTVMASTASSGAKRRQSIGSGDEDTGKAALDDLLRSAKSKVERELAGMTQVIRQPLKARYK